MIPRGLLKEYAGPLSMLLRAFDMAAMVAAGIIAFYYKFGNVDLPESYIKALAISAIYTLAIFSFFHIYQSVRTKGFWEHIRTLSQAITIVLMSMAGTAFLTKSGANFSRGWFGWWVILSFVLLLLFRGTLLGVLRVMRANRWNERRVIIIGATDLGRRLAGSMQEALWTGFRVMAIFDETPENQSANICGISVKRMPGSLSNYLASCKETVDEIWLALPLSAEEQMKKIMHELRHDTVSVRLVLDIFGFGLFSNSIMDLAGFPALALNSSPMVGVNRLMKALEDRILAAVILICISPLLLLITLGVKYTSEGPVFFKQLRHGWDGRIINIYKFRTMYDHTEYDGKVTQASFQDKRITPFGRFLRKTSLDELPQFINVLQGRMSIVGPRPHAVSHNEFYKDSIKAYMQRHRVKPGITGWAQVNGWRGETDTLNKMEKRIEFDLFYIEHWSLVFDLKIIFLTIFQGFINKNAY
jgi:putative colanic acid biosynthesis UDP-glucose lipid carrier transferase